MKEASSLRRPVGALAPLVALRALLTVLLPVGRPGPGQRAAVRARKLATNRVHPAQPACTGSRLREGILSAPTAASGASRSARPRREERNVEIVDGDGTAWSTPRPVATDASGVAEFEVTPDGTWDRADHGATPPLQLPIRVARRRSSSEPARGDGRGPFGRPSRTRLASPSSSPAPSRRSTRSPVAPTGARPCLRASREPRGRGRQALGQPSSRRRTPTATTPWRSPAPRRRGSTAHPNRTSASTSA